MKKVRGARAKFDPRAIDAAVKQLRELSTRRDFRSLGVVQTRACVDTCYSWHIYHPSQPGPTRGFLCRCHVMVTTETADALLFELDKLRRPQQVRKVAA